MNALMNEQSKLRRSDVAGIVGLPDHVLSRYAHQSVFDGLCPRELNCSDWDAALCAAVSQIQILRANGQSIEDVAKVTMGGHKALLAASKEAAFDIQRAARRAFKAVCGWEERIARYAAPVETYGPYLRFLPERWYSYILIQGDEACLPYGSGHAEAMQRLNQLAQVVGWCAYQAFANMSSYDASFRLTDVFEMQQLVCPPAVSSGPKGEDGGCYRMFGSHSACNPDCSCAECDNFGRVPTAREESAWATFARMNPTAWNRVCEGCAEVPSQSHSGASVPSVVPISARLPYGIGCLHFPAGFYLCLCADGGTISLQRDRMLGLLMSLDTVPSTRVEEPASTSLTVEPKEDGPFLFELSRLSSLRLCVDAALPPDDGFLLNVESMPLCDERKEPRYEIQALVDATALFDGMGTRAQSHQKEIQA